MSIALQGEAAFIEARSTSPTPPAESRCVAFKKRTRAWLCVRSPGSRVSPIPGVRNAVPVSWADAMALAGRALDIVEHEFILVL